MRTLAISVAMLLMTACEGHYRYPCQDPANFKKPECNPPLCYLENDCSQNLIGAPEPKEPPVTEDQLIEQDTILKEI